MIQQYMNDNFNADVEKYIDQAVPKGLRSYARSKRGANSSFKKSAIEYAQSQVYKHMKTWNESIDLPLKTQNDWDSWNETTISNYKNRSAISYNRKVSQIITVNEVLAVVADGAGMIAGTIILVTPNGFNYAGLMATLISTDNFIKDMRVIIQKLNGEYKGDVGTLGGSLIGSEKAYSLVGIGVNITSGIKGAGRLFTGASDWRDNATFLINSHQNTSSAIGIITD